MVPILVLALCGTGAWGQPVITNQPQTQAVGHNKQAIITVGVSGDEPLACQWQRNMGAGFSDMAGCTNPALVLTNVQSWDAWDYRAVVTNPGGAQTSTVAHLYVVCPGLLTNREAIDDFADNRFNGRIEGRGSVLESNAQFSIFGNFPLPTHSTYDSYVMAGYPKTWTVSDGTTREWRAELVDLNENGTNTAILTVGSDTGAGYIFHKGQEFVFLLKWSANGSYCFLSCERVPLRSTNVILALALTRVQANLVLTTRVLDMADPSTVLYEHSVVDTPGADPTLTAAQFQALTGIRLNDVAPDAPGTPPIADAVWLGVFQYTDGRQPVPKATFDNLSVWTYQVPITRFVDAGSAHPTPPYTNWATAASVIQDAVDAAAPGDEVAVTNGIYATGGRAVGTDLLVNRVAVDKPLVLRSVNGPQFTVIQGYQVPGNTNGDSAVRCMYLANDASLSGFTLTGGATRAAVAVPDVKERSGGGVWCESRSAVVSNCVLAGNSAGAGGGAWSGTLNNCTLIGNSATGSTLRGGGGGAYDSILNGCTLTGNAAEWAGGAVAVLRALP